MTFLGLGDVAEGLGVLGGEFAQAFFVEMDAAFVAVDLAFEFQAALLGVADFVFEHGKLFAQVRDFILAAEDVLRKWIRFQRGIFRRSAVRSLISDCRTSN